MTAAVALLSAATVAAEILLVRRLAIEHFHHFAYLAVGVAMLGAGTAGTVLAAFPPRPERRGTWFRACALGCALSLVASPLLASAIRLDATQLAWSAAEWPRLALLVLVLSAPFAAGAAAVLLAISLDATRAGRTYGASFAGGAAGCALAIAGLAVATPARALVIPPLLSAGAALVASRGRRATSVVALAALAGSLLPATPLGALRLTPYKGLPQVEALPNARRVAERTSPVGWVVAVEAPSFRHAPGLSLAYRGRFPRMTALLVDGDVAGAAADWREAPELLAWLPTAAPYSLGSVRSVLIVGAGGGHEVELALRQGAARAVGIELHPALPALARRAPWPAGAELVTGDARAFAARTRERFDLVSLGPSSGPGASSAGIHALAEDPLHSVEAYVAFLALLEPGGLLAVTRWAGSPPREGVRAVLTTAEALRLRGRKPANTVALVRSWATVTVLARPDGFDTGALERLRDWARERWFDVDWPPGPQMQPFNTSDDPALLEAAAAAARSREDAAHFASSSTFDVAPVSDSRPYPHHFLRPGAVLAFLRHGTRQWLPFAEWGPIAVVATLALSTALGAALLAAPLASATARRSRPRAAALGWFACLGLGYLAAELAAIQQLGLLLGHPVYAVSAALVGFLAFSGAGAATSDRLSPTRARCATAAAAGLIGVLAAALLPVVHGLVGTPLAIRMLAAVTLVAPLAFVLGMPFTLGLRRLTPDGGPAAAWAWAANGFASVVAAPLSALIALEAGSRALFAAAAAAYATAALIGGLAFSRCTQRRRRPCLSFAKRG
jgi:hypothetical protein